MAEPPARHSCYARSWDGAPDGRLRAPAAERNAEVLTETLAPHLEGASGTLLEIGSGSGQHAALWARRFPDLTIQPSDPAPEHIASIDAWAAEAGNPPNLCPAIALDVLSGWPDLGQLSAVLAVNVIHIAPWSVAEAITAGAGTHLSPGGALIFYGPFRREGHPTAPSNEAFDESLRSRDPTWGVRDLEAIAALARSEGLGPPQVTEMPANNLTVIFRKDAPNP